MASFGAFNRDFLTSSWAARPAAHAFSTESFVDEVAPDTERSPGYQSETRIGLGRAPESLVMVVEEDLDSDAEPPTVRTFRRADYDAAALAASDDEVTDSDRRDRVRRSSSERAHAALRGRRSFGCADRARRRAGLDAFAACASRGRRHAEHPRTSSPAPHARAVCARRVRSARSDAQRRLARRRERAHPRRGVRSRYRGSQVALTSSFNAV